jgi:AraC-like DNA-binding protein
MNTFSGATGVAVDVPCYSARFIQPFAQVLSTYECFAVESLNKLRAIDPATRIPATIANDMAVRHVQQTGDPDLGLKAGRSMPLGCAGALDYAMHSAATVREAIGVADRYTRLFSDLLNIHLEVQGERANVRIEVGLAAPRPVPDFTMSAWFTNHTRKPLPTAARLECWFAHPKPADTNEYERTFEPASLRFDAPCYGFAFGREYLDAPLATADPVLHAVLCEHVALTLTQLSKRKTLAARVREIAMRELLHTTPTVFSVARQLRMSARTLGRRLEREGTTFSVLLDHLRQELALRYVGSHEMPFTEVAFRLGFSHVEAFYRAFKRWTGQTPLTYRRARGLASDGPFLLSPGAAGLGLPPSPSSSADQMASSET